MKPLTILLVALSTNAMAQSITPLSTSRYEPLLLYTAGKLEGCGLRLLGTLGDNPIVAVDAGIILRLRGNKVDGVITISKRAAQLHNNKISEEAKPIASGWIRAGSLMFTAAEAPAAKNTRASVYGMERTVELLKAVLSEKNTTVGIQKSPGQIDELYEFANSLDDKTKRHIGNCLYQMADTADATSKK